LDDSIKAIWAARGGYGSNHLLPLLKNLKVPVAKPLIGSSDISYLLWYLLDHFPTPVYYGPMAYSSLPDGRYHADNLKAILGGNSIGVVYSGQTLIAGEACGKITGGCLSNLVSLLGTSFFPKSEGRLLLLEDVGERPYKLDRMFWQLNQAGVFERIKGLVLGRFPNCFNHAGERENFLQRVRDYIEPFQIPVIYDLPVGHGDNLHTLPLGIESQIRTPHLTLV
ncbi:MAG: LD-carboxypeptidase, partial [bacterium]|nr:LD-carboxypeptidase [bacterium]